MSQNDLTDLESASNEQFDRLDELTSLFFDDALSAEDAAELNQRLLEDKAARARLFESAQLHADLYAYYREEKQASVSPALPLPLPGLGLPSTH